MDQPSSNPFQLPEAPSGHKIGLAVACLQISAGLYLMVGLLMFGILVGPYNSGEIGIAVLMLVFCVALIVGIQIVVAGLRRRRFWAWVAGLCIFGIYLPSLFFPLGALGLWGLLDSGSRAEFGVGG